MQRKKLEDELAEEKKKHAEEMEQLRAELTKKKEEVAPPSPGKEPLSGGEMTKKEEVAPPSPGKEPLPEADAEAVRKIKAQGKRTRRPTARSRSSTSTR